MGKYRVQVSLDEEYDIEADSEEKASDIAVDFAVNSGSWSIEVEPLEDQEAKDE